MTYRIDRFEVVEIGRLSPHADALMPIEADDEAVIAGSVADAGGVYQPLLVVEAGDGYAIVDGCNRWRAAQAAGLERLPCLVVECEEPRRLVAECLGVGRKRTSAQRVMAFLEVHRAKVLQAAKLGEEMAAGTLRGRFPNSKKSKQISAVSNDTAEFLAEWGSKGIAARLHVSNKDVLAGIDLLRMRDAGECPPDMERPDDDGAWVRWRRAMDEYRNEVLAGHTTNLRRWKAAVGGKYATKGEGAEKGRSRAKVRPFDVMDEGMDHIETGIRLWGEMTGRQRGLIEERWREIMTRLPEQLR